MKDNCPASMIGMGVLYLGDYYRILGFKDDGALLVIKIPAPYKSAESYLYMEQCVYRDETKDYINSRRMDKVEALRGW